MPQDKLSRINAMLLLANENPVAVEDDGSNEWNVCNAGFQIFEARLEQHDWKFATSVVALNRIGDSPDNLFDDAYAKPNGCLHLIWVRVNDVRPLTWRIIDNTICLSAGTLVAGAVTAKFVRDVDESKWSAIFGQALNCDIKAAIYEGLKQDFASARALRAEAEMWMSKAQTRTDQEQPKRALFRSRLKEARLVRRPVWPRNLPGNSE